MYNMLVNLYRANKVTKEYVQSKIGTWITQAQYDTPTAPWNSEGEL